METMPDLAVVTFDLAASGVNRNALRIAAAAREGGLATELWIAQDHGELSTQVPDGVPLRSLGGDLGVGYTRTQRRAAIAKVTSALSGLVVSRRPRVMLSAGNHVHSLTVGALPAKDRHPEVRLVGRVSNALQRVDYSKWEELWRSVIKRPAARKRYSSMDRLIAVTDEIRVDLIGKMGVDPDRVAVIHNGIDLERAQQLADEELDHPWFAPGAPRVVLGVGRLMPQKNFALLLRSFAIARKRLPMRLVIIGEGPPRYREKLVSIARDLGVTDDVWFAGFVANPFPFYRAAGLFVLSSLWEGMSNVLLEAMASGCPVVATRAPGGSAEMLAEGKYGPLVEVGDEAGLARAMVERLLQPRSSEVLKQRAGEFDLEASMHEYVSVIEEELALVAK